MGRRSIDTRSLLVHKKRVRPISKQGDHESRRQWQHVTNALRHNDINTASDHNSLVRNQISGAKNLNGVAQHDLDRTIQPHTQHI